MKYLLMIYGNQEKWESMAGGAWPEAIARQEAFNAKYRQTGELLGSYGLADAAQAKLVRRVKGLPAVTDGPYLETKEYLASYCLIDCETIERATEIAVRWPDARYWAVELRPLMSTGAAEE